ncbi:hypothetical protein [Neobacillus niacini]|uniref:hypothetical protein n=1 Tax=Neobacillus niacini TaxID=86668 RepID=UPI0021CB848C|nr:hypothetical protein [Neobacillus niacini]MCM3767856.1 hypothetical protein [Neobacillus niacini]
MALNFLFHIFRKTETKVEWQKRLLSLEKNIAELEKLVCVLQEQAKPDKAKKTNDPPIIIEKINIEKIILDKYELNNNLGQLGIKELKGKLNIGATYGSEFTPSLAEDEKSKKSKVEKREQQTHEKGPKVNINAKKD